MNYSESLFSSPTFSKTVYDALPPFLKNLIDLFDDPRAKDIILSSILAMIGGCVGNNVKGNYRNDWVSPNLFLFVVAPPASGKSIMKFAKQLGTHIQEEFKKANLQAKKEFKLKMQAWE